MMLYDMIWYDMIWYGMIRYDMIWYDMIWYDMIWYDMIWWTAQKISIRRCSSGCCRSAWKICCNEKTAFHRNSTLNRHTLWHSVYQMCHKQCFKKEKVRQQLCYLFNNHKVKTTVSISPPPVFPLEIKQIFNFACRGSDPGGGGHIFFFHTTLTYNNGRIRMMNYINTPRANSSRELTNNRRVRGA